MVENAPSPNSEPSCGGGERETQTSHNYDGFIPEKKVITIGRRRRLRRHSYIRIPYVIVSQTVGRGPNIRGS